MRYVKCGECDVLMSPVWKIDTWIIGPDSMISDDERDRAEPFVASHIAPNSIESCPHCKYVFKTEDQFSYCLVNHGDNTACLSCPGCNSYIKKGAIWHKTEWTRDDLEDDGKTYEEIKIDGVDRETFYKMGELKATKFPPGRIRDLE